MTRQEQTLTAQLLEANRNIQDMSVEKKKLTKKRDAMQDRFVFFKKLKIYI